MKLYEIAKELREIESLIDSGEMVFEELFDTIESLDIMFDEKIENCCYLIKESEARSSGINSEIKRLQDLKRLEDSKSDSLKNYIRHQMELAGRTKIKGKLFNVSLGKPTDIVVINDESALPDCAFETVRKVISKTEIKKLVQAGEIKSGASIEAGTPRLTIK